MRPAPGGGQSLTPRPGDGGEQPVDNVLGERIQLKPATIAPCSGEEWQRAIDLLAEIFVPLLADAAPMSGGLPRSGKELG
jgi:hypothetical protein